MVGNGIVDSEPSISQNRTEFFGNRLWNGNRLGWLTLCDTAANAGHFANCDFHSVAMKFETIGDALGPNPLDTNGNLQGIFTLSRRFKLASNRDPRKADRLPIDLVENAVPPGSQHFVFSRLHIAKKRREMRDARHIGVAEFNKAGRAKGSCHATQDSRRNGTKPRLQGARGYVSTRLTEQVGSPTNVALIATVGHQGHEAGTLDCPGNSMLAGGMATRLSSAHNASVAIRQLS